MKIVLFLTPVIIAPALLAAAPAAAQVMTPSEYVMAAGASDLYERTSSQLVLQSTQDPRIRSFAQEMIADHGKTTPEVKSAAQRSRIAVSPPRLIPVQNELIAELRAESGPARDRAYVAQQRVSHGQALTVQKAYAADGNAPALKVAAADVVPVGQDHIDKLMKM